MDLRHFPQPDRERAIARLLARRYGDGGIYLPRQTRQPSALRDAIDGGFVSVDGFVTRKGRQLLAQFNF